MAIANINTTYPLYKTIPDIPSFANLHSVDVDLTAEELKKIFKSALGIECGYLTNCERIKDVKMFFQADLHDHPDFKKINTIFLAMFAKHGDGLFLEDSECACCSWMVDSNLIRERDLVSSLWDTKCNDEIFYKAQLLMKWREEIYLKFNAWRQKKISNEDFIDAVHEVLKRDAIKDAYTIIKDKLLKEKAVELPSYPDFDGTNASDIKTVKKYLLIFNYICEQFEEINKNSERETDEIRNVQMVQSVKDFHSDKKNSLSRSFLLAGICHLVDNPFEESYDPYIANQLYWFLGDPNYGHDRLKYFIFLPHLINMKRESNKLIYNSDSIYGCAARSSSFASKVASLSA
jgi:hypothetical protein